MSTDFHERIGSYERSVLIKTAAIEVTTSRLPFSVQVAGIKAAFEWLQARSNAQFEFHSRSSSEPDSAIFETTFGTFQLTPQKGSLIRNGDGPAEPVSFYADADPSLPLLSAAVRFAERKANQLQILPVSPIQDPKPEAQNLPPEISSDEIETLVAAARIEVATSKLFFPQQMAIIRAANLQMEAMPYSTFQFIASEMSLDRRSVVFESSIGRTRTTAYKGEAEIRGADGTPKWVSIFSSADATASVVSALVRYTGRHAILGELLRHQI